MYDNLIKPRHLKVRRWVEPFFIKKIPNVTFNGFELKYTLKAFSDFKNKQQMCMK